MSRGYWTHLSLSVCFDLRHSLCRSPSVTGSNFTQNYTFPFTSFFFFLHLILPLLANHRRPKRAHTETHMHCQLVFTHSCMQLPATRRYLKHETLWPVLFIRSIEIAAPSMSIKLPSESVCASVYGEHHPAYDAPGGWWLSRFSESETCVLSRLYQFSETFCNPCHTYKCKCVPYYSEQMNTKAETRATTTCKFTNKTPE